MKGLKRLFAVLFSIVLFMNGQVVTVYSADGVTLFSTNIFCDNSEEGCDSDALSTARFICVNRLTEEGLQKVLENPNLEQIQIADITNLPIEDVAQLYPYLCKDNIEYSAILLAYENVGESVGNDGTDAYRYAVENYAPDSSAYYRSCATTVSAILNAAGYLDGYSSAGVSGLVNYFDNHPSEWECKGKLDSADMQEGDVIFIDRQSHKADYIKGLLSDGDFDIDSLLASVLATNNSNSEETDEALDTLDLGADDGIVWDADGNYYLKENKQYGYYAPGNIWTGYVTEGGRYDPYGNVVPLADGDAYAVSPDSPSEVTPKGNYNEVFNPDEDGNGVVDEEEGKKWNDYWEEKGEVVPSYDYYNTWKADSEEYQAKVDELLDNLDLDTLKTSSGKDVKIHNHIIVWLGNDVVSKYYPDSKGNIVSGSYSEAYEKARSASVSNFNFTGDYKVYRHI